MKSKYKLIAALGIVFMLGWLLNDLYAGYVTNLHLRPLENGNFGKYFLVNVMGQEPVERVSPSDIIRESQISIGENHVLVEIKNPNLAFFADTNSMDPVLDEAANAIEIIPETESDVKIGDIISYYSKEKNAVLVHRVIGMGSDSKGNYFILKGDNNAEPDPEKVRFSQIQRKIAIIIY